MAEATVPARTDEATFAAFLQVHRAHVLRFLRRLSRHDAEDLLQETFAKVWRLRASFDPRQNGSAWLLQAAFRTFCDQRQRLRRSPPTRPAAVEALASDARCRSELRDEVAHWLAGLEPLARELLLGFHAHGLSLRELAARHRLPLNTVKSHLHRARQQVRARPDPDHDPG
jgi:RNA polymerase sigma-70 factor (ECF subfamily)